MFGRLMKVIQEPSAGYGRTKGHIQGHIHEQQTPGLDGAVSHDEFQSPSPMPEPLDPEQRAEMEAYVLQHTPGAHIYTTSKGLKGIVYYDERGRAAANVIEELPDETIAFLATQKGYKSGAESDVIMKTSNEERCAVPDEIASILSEAKSSATSDTGELPDGVKLQQKPGADYWYVRRGAVTIGVISKDDEGMFDADTDPDGGGKYKQGFRSKEEAARWILANNESVDDIDGGVLGEAIEVIPPYSNGMWVIRVEDALKKRLGRSFTWKKPILRDGSNALIYRWSAKKSRGQLIPWSFKVRIEYDPGRDLYDVTMSLIDPEGQVVQEKRYHHVYIDQVTDPSFVTSWLRR